MHTQYTTKDLARFYSKIRIMPNGCHEWTASVVRSGHGQFKIGGTYYPAHRIAWEIANGPIPDGLAILHHCGNRRCVNPEHLYPRTQEIIKERNAALTENNIARFYDRIRIASNGCHEWTGGITNGGYGRLSLGGHDSISAHRLAWLIAYGPIPDDLFVCHHCDNRICVNPAHLFLGTARDNIQDAADKGRMTRGETNHFAKLTEDDVREIKRLSSSGATGASIARQFNVSEFAVYSVLRRYSWKHVE